MSDQEKHKTSITHDFSTLRELFMEYVTLDYPFDNETRELVVPWYSITQILSQTNKDDYENRSRSCSKIAYQLNGKNEECYVNETPQQVEEKIQAAKGRMLAAIRKERMMII